MPLRKPKQNSRYKWTYNPDKKRWELEMNGYFASVRVANKLAYWMVTKDSESGEIVKSGRALYDKFAREDAEKVIDEQSK